ncbi:ASCH domain-containing protein [Paenibacillus sp.]|uniref:ASCH domain-containing protein n=1 Tax=Paenibacillus sp. TaxID=58172 RepID=UPI0028114E6E|nr:ASCH domain-containing protein [Paenibacillus sp.]
MSEVEAQDVMPPKTCSIEKLVTKEAEIRKIVAGTKTATRRNGRYADIGETMTLQGREFVIERVYRQSLGDLTDEHARQEGYDSVEEYKEAILSYHPGMPWLPHMKVWVHEFREV